MEGACHDHPSGGRFVGRQHCYPVRVFFEDTDLSGSVYHANYLRYMERARSDMLRVAGIDQRRFHDAGEGMYVVTDVAIRYRLPARLDDAFLVISHLVRSTAARAVIHQTVMRGNDVLSDASVTAALVGPDGRPRRHPPAWRAIFKGLTGQGEP